MARKHEDTGSGTDQGRTTSTSTSSSSTVIQQQLEGVAELTLAKYHQWSDLPAQYQVMFEGSSLYRAFRDHMCWKTTKWCRLDGMAPTDAGIEILRAIEQGREVQHSPGGTGWEDAGKLVIVATISNDFKRGVQSWRVESEEDC